MKMPINNAIYILSNFKKNMKEGTELDDALDVAIEVMKDRQQSNINRGNQGQRQQKS